VADNFRISSRAKGNSVDVNLRVPLAGDVASEKLAVTRTEEIPTRRISPLKLGATVEETSKGGVTGWECTPPRIGRPYAMCLYEGMILRTSPVQDIRKTECALIIKTLNSLYRLEYLAEDQRA
jgi:hypothetical protein